MCPGSLNHAASFPHNLDSHPPPPPPPPPPPRGPLRPLHQEAPAQNHPTKTNPASWPDQSGDFLALGKVYQLME